MPRCVRAQVIFQSLVVGCGEEMAEPCSSGSHLPVPVVPLIPTGSTAEADASICCVQAKGRGDQPSSSNALSTSTASCSRYSGGNRIIVKELSGEETLMAELGHVTVRWREARTSALLEGLIDLHSTKPWTQHRDKTLPGLWKGLVRCDLCPEPGCSPVHPVLYLPDKPR